MLGYTGFDPEAVNFLLVALTGGPDICSGCGGGGHGGEEAGELSCGTLVLYDLAVLLGLDRGAVHAANHFCR